mgnify:CR=1 FL=1
MKNLKNLIKKLTEFDTPTICNGMELVDSKYKLNHFTKKSFFLSKISNFELQNK